MSATHSKANQYGHAPFLWIKSRWRICRKTADSNFPPNFRECDACLMKVRAGVKCNSWSGRRLHVAASTVGSQPGARNFASICVGDTGLHPIPFDRRECEGSADNKVPKKSSRRLERYWKNRHRPRFQLISNGTSKQGISRYCVGFFCNCGLHAASGGFGCGDWLAWSCAACRRTDNLSNLSRSL